MKLNKIFFLLLTVIFAACAGQNAKIMFYPDSGQQDTLLEDQVSSTESWEIIESQNGPGENGIPEWIYRYYKRELRELESQGIRTPGVYGNRYIFVGRNQGNNFSALQQWVYGFSVEHILPRLIAQRVERRLIASASLYPNDEYGEYFENLIKQVSDSEFSGKLEEPIFWLKRRMISNSDETEDDAEVEHYEFLALISVDKETLQAQLTEIMMGIKTTVSPTRDQTAAINKIRQSFFEGF